jgi:hypothetical protein
MPACKTCGREFEWGYNQDTGKWVLLEPVATHDDLPRTFLDEDGTLRADHRDRHEKGSSGVNVTRLTKKIPVEMAREHSGAIVTVARKWRRGARQ